ncbi:MAG: histone deacetylase family protein [Deltaproteobacteria bacterium]|nr:histone deacetylase family protein [Deltaproteobacteria bacterium]
MFRIRRIYDDTLPVDGRVIGEVQQILREQFPLLSEETVRKMPEQLRDPLKFRFRSILFVAEGARGRVKGFALLQHAPDLAFCYLDFIAAATRRTGGGVGSALYEKVRDEALSLQSIGLFFECLPDDPRLCRDPEIRKQNMARLRFYERYGARPIANTAYETPLNPEDDCPPYLVYDNLGKNRILFRNRMRRIVRAILERKYGDLCPRGYIDMVVRSFRDHPVRFRTPCYVKAVEAVEVRPVRSVERTILLAVNDRHDIHHIRERGYVESPVRIQAILRDIEPLGIFEPTKVRHFSERFIKRVHDGGFVNYFKKVCAYVDPGASVYPYVFPIRNNARPPKELPIRAGYYCIDTFTPINRNAYLAAKRAVDCALTVAGRILEGYRFGYALVRPPGHHAERRAFGGFCYFNSAAVAAQYLSAWGKVAVLDLDYHHGNGTQDIFYGRSDVLTVSIHAHPRFAYPYFSGFEDERGEGEGAGFNVNMPLPEHLREDQYRETLSKALRRILRFRPRFLVLALGLDTAKGDPTGSWNLRPGDFRVNGRMIGSLRLPTLVIQEGGYRIRSLGSNARHFFLGLWEGAGQWGVRP